MEQQKALCSLGLGLIARRQRTKHLVGRHTIGRGLGIADIGSQFVKGGGDDGCITLGYTIPIQKRYIQKLRVYVSGNDIWEKSDILKVFDPLRFYEQDKIPFSLFTIHYYLSSRQLCRLELQRSIES